MNVRRGFFRLWILGSILWVTGWLWAYPWPLHEGFMCTFRLTDNPYCQFRDPYSDYPAIALLGPVIALAIWLVGEWIVRGFRTPQKPN
jgi:hypothetical protein